MQMSMLSSIILVNISNLFLIELTNDFNSVISAPGSRKLDLNGWLGLGVASVRDVSGLDYIRGSGVLGITSEISF